MIVNPAQADEPIEIPFGGGDLHGSLTVISAAVLNWLLFLS